MNKRTILIVDDDENVRNLSQRLFNRMGYTSLTACDGIEALTKYEESQRNVVLVLLDVIMPKLDGIATYHKLREISDEVPVFFCSGQSSEGTDDILKRDPKSRFFPKPCQFEQIDTALSSILKEITP